MVAKESGGRHMRRMAGVDINVGHCGHHGGEHHIPAFGRVLVEAYFNALEAWDYCGERFERRFEFQSHFLTLLRRALKFECHNVLYHDGSGRCKSFLVESVYESLKEAVREGEWQP